MRFPVLLALAAAVCASPAFATNFVGSTTGTFANPQPSGVTTGVGTSKFSFGDSFDGSGAPSTLSFAGVNFTTSTSTPFKIGTLSYFNGTSSLGTVPSSVDLALNVALTAPASRMLANTFTLGLQSTPNTGTPDENADYVFFPSSFSTSNYSINGQAYQLQLTGFGNVVGDGFLTSNSSEFRVREGGSASADLFARVAAVPEPASWAMMIVGVGAVGGSLRRRQKVTARVAFA